MPWWKQLLLAAYYAASAPARGARNRAMAARGRAPVIVAAFHRIADDRANRWTTPTDDFRRGILWLKRRADLVSLAEAQQRIRNGANHRPAVVITFDDGYEINCQRALPLLLDEQVPFTYFVTSDPVLHGGYFPHDLAMGHRLPANNVAQLRKLAAHELVEIGAHTRTHVDLGRVTDAEVLFDEVVRSREELQDALGVPIRQFAFPFGQHANLSDAAFALAAEHGFDCVVSAYGGYNFPGDDPFHLQRMCCDGPLIKLKNFASIDPLKQLCIQRYEPGKVAEYLTEAGV